MSKTEPTLPALCVAPRSASDRAECEWSVTNCAPWHCRNLAAFNETATGKRLCQKHADYLRERWGAQMTPLPNIGYEPRDCGEKSKQ